MNALQSDNIVVLSSRRATSESASIQEKLAGWLVALVFLAGYFAVWGYVVMRGSADQSLSSPYEAVTYIGL
jgi:hypothetical protein